MTEAHEFDETFAELDKLCTASVVSAAWLYAIRKATNDGVITNDERKSISSSSAAWLAEAMVKAGVDDITSLRDAVKAVKLPKKD